MAAEARPIPDGLHVAIISASATTSAIRALIETTQANVKTSILSKEEFTEINDTMRDQISMLTRPLDDLKQIIHREELWRKGILPDDIYREMSSILFSYGTVNGILDMLEYEVSEGGDMDVVNKTGVNSAYSELLVVLRDMERRWDAFLTRVDPLMAGQAMNHRGGYRKRKQRTQRKQRKQKHCKTHRKRK